MKNSLEQIKELLRKANTVLVAGHSDPDGDSIGSMLGLGQLLERQGKTVSYLCVDAVPRVYSFLPGTDKVKKNVPFNQTFDAMFVVDSSDLSRIGDKTTDFRAIAKKIVNLDHHPDNTQFGDINCVGSASSAAEVVFDLAVYLKLPFDKQVAECLYVGLITDTGNFRYENTSVKTFRMAAELMEFGINTHDITTRIYDTRTVKAVKMAAMALANIQFAGDGKICWAAITSDMMEQVGAMGEDVVGIVDHLRSIEGVEVAIFFREKDGVIKMNFRSKNRVNVSEIARKFGGGGHIKAAGAGMPGPIEKVEALVIAETEKHLQALKYLVI
ncbi:MAG: bifunctional oligoribonuclease/PAP phosphatase NrnA [Candidatus Margulisiibacteriota bacterium]